jgi:hypothetical protein
MKGKKVGAEVKGWPTKLTNDELIALKEFKKSAAFGVYQKIIEEKLNHHAKKLLELQPLHLDTAALVISERRGHYREGKELLSAPDKAEKELARRGREKTKK